MSCWYSSWISAIWAEEERIGGVALVEPLSSAQRPWRLPLVPQVDDVKLVVGLALQQPPAVARAQHLLEPFLPVAARAAAGRSGETLPPPAPRRRRYLYMPMPKYASSRFGSSATARSSATLMFLPSRAAASFSSLRTRHCTRARVGAAEVEPGLGVSGDRSRPVLGGVDGPIDRGRELGVERSLSGSSRIRHHRAVAASTSQASGGAGPQARRSSASTWSKRASRMKS